MQIHLIVGQRKERYAGEFAPEVLDACDEFTLDENPDLLLKLLCKHREDESFEAVEAVAIEVSTQAIMSRLRPVHSPIQAEVRP